MRRTTYLLLLSFIVLLALVYFHPLPVPQIQKPANLSPIASSSAVLGARTKVADCVVNGVLPDSECTPGAVFPDVTRDQVCTSGYSATVRDVPDSEKKQVYAEYGIASHFTGQYEVDHLISLELGGSNDISNLWPEAAEPRPGFHEKDQVENFLHREVCQGLISLLNAQDIIAHNWQSVIINN
jgi:hypothetical protein